MSRPLSPDS